MRGVKRKVYQKSAAEWLRYTHWKSLRRIKERIRHLPDFTPPSYRLIGHKPVDIIFWPAYPNPYQTLFYGLPSKLYTTREGTIDHALQRIESAHSDCTIVFHLHWLNTLINSNDTPDRARSIVDSFVGKLRRFRMNGGFIAWTIHNILSHDTPHSELEIELCQQLTSLSNLIVVHGNAALEETRSYYSIPSDKTLVIPHGSYVDIYRNQISGEQARNQLGIKDFDCVFLVFGLIRPYKGIVDLIQAVAAKPELYNHVHLVIAGRPLGVTEQELLAKSDGRVRISFHLRHIADNEVEVFMQASDWIVLPYRKVLTSGSALLAMSFGKPLIAPRIGLLPELIEDRTHGILYWPPSITCLQSALASAVTMPKSEHDRLAEASLSRARDITWSQGREAFLRRIRELASQKGITNGKG